jgi:tetratricopeptide (TPR) repeat protein
MLRTCGAVMIGVCSLYPVIAIFSQQSARSIDAVGISKLAKPLTVLIESEGENGSGVLISKGNGRYTVLTAAHVLTNQQKKYQITTSKDGVKHQLLPSSIQSFPNNIDLATVEFSSNNNYEIAKIGNSDNAAEGSWAFVSGFPRTTLTISSSIYSFREGKIIANSAKPLNGGYAIIYSANTLPGMSGGGVFNDAGELIAIHGRGDIDIKYRADQVNENVRFKTGNDLGIPINIFVSFAKNSRNDLSTAIANQPTSNRQLSEASGHFVEGVGRARQQDHPGAITSYNRAINTNRRFAAAYLNRGISRAELGDNQGSLADQATSLEIDPNQSIALLNRGVLRYRQGDKAGALQDYTAAIKIQPNDPIAYFNRAIVHADLKNPTEAVADYTKAIEYQPDFVSAYYNRGISYMKLGKNSEAFADFDQVIQIQPNYPQAFVNRGNLKFQLGNGTGAVSDYTKAIALKPDYALAYANRASAYLKIRNTPAALKDLRKAAQLYQQQGNQAKYQEVMALYRRLGGREI